MNPFNTKTRGRTVFDVRRKFVVICFASTRRRNEEINFRDHFVQTKYAYSSPKVCYCNIIYSITTDILYAFMWLCSQYDRKQHRCIVNPHAPNTRSRRVCFQSKVVYVINNYLNLYLKLRSRRIKKKKK